MSAVTHDIEVAVASPRTSTGLVLALLSAVSFAMSGSFASALFSTGWSPGASALVRSTIGALVALPFGLRALRGRWWLVRQNLGLLAAYGVLAVGGAQFCYFMAVQRMDVGPALLIEYTSPAMVVVWLWLRHGQRPGLLTLGGALLAALGLVLVLNLLGGTRLDPFGVMWSLLAMVGAVTYFVVNADHASGLPPVTLATGGLVLGAAAVGLLGLVGVLPMAASTAHVTLSGQQWPWWVPILGLGAITAGFAYLSGVAAGRLLGARVAAFVSLFEVVAGVGFAWLFLAQLPGMLQLVGGVLILAGVIVVKVGERGPTADPVV